MPCARQPQYIAAPEQIMAYMKYDSRKIWESPHPASLWTFATHVLLPYRAYDPKPQRVPKIHTKIGGYGQQQTTKPRAAEGQVWNRRGFGAKGPLQKALFGGWFITSAQSSFFWHGLHCSIGNWEIISKIVRGLFLQDGDIFCNGKEFGVVIWESGLLHSSMWHTATSKSNIKCLILF